MGHAITYKSLETQKSCPPLLTRTLTERAILILCDLGGDGLQVLLESVGYNEEDQELPVIGG